MANQVVNYNRAATNPRRVSQKARQLFGTQVVRKQAATDHVERTILKGKCEPIGYNGSWIPVKVRPHAIQESEVQRDASPQQSPANEAWNLTESRSHLEYREMRLSCESRNPFDQRLSSGDSSKPAVHAAKIAQGTLDLLWRTLIRVENLGCGYSLHPRRIASLYPAELALLARPPCSRRGPVAVESISPASVRLRPALLPATACYTGRCSSRSRRGVRRACPVRRCVRRAARRYGRHCARLKPGVR